MSYVVADAEISAPLLPIELGPNDGGLGLLVRRNDRPISFVLQQLAPSSRFSPTEVGELITATSAVEILEDMLRAELLEPTMPSRGVSLTIVVCTRGHAQLLAKCLQSVLRLRRESEEFRFDIVVIDNAPPDAAARDLVHSLRGVRYVCEPKPGLDFARNRALQETTTDFVAFVDDDVEVDYGWLEGLEEALNENPDAAAITGLVLPHRLSTEAQIRFESRGGFRRGFGKVRYGTRKLGEFVYPVGAGNFGAGCNMVLNRKVTLGIGAFDEALDTGPPLPGGGDLDLFYRVVRAGYPLVYEPRMLAFHKHRRDHQQLRRQYWSWGTGFMAFVAKTYAADEDQRSKLRRLLRWWLLSQLRELRRSVTGKSHLTPDLLAAELIGGLVGLAGTYPRSVRRIERIRAEWR
jgi:glycosyltransferase involved in cell wall biosynthesis